MCGTSVSVVTSSVSTTRGTGAKSGGAVVLNLEIQTRPGWDKYFFRIADVVGSRSTCRVPVGAVYVDNENRIISTGYNGAPSGMPHCIEVGCLFDHEGRCVRTLHAETNGALHADSSRLKGSRLYTTRSPCLSCAKLLVVLKVGHVKATELYHDPSGVDFLRQAGVLFSHHERATTSDNATEPSGAGGI